MSLTAAVINAGIGDLSLGLQMAGFQIAVAFEPDERAAAIHQTNLHNEIIPLSLEQIEPGMLPNVDLLAARIKLPPPKLPCSGSSRFQSASLIGISQTPLSLPDL